MEQELIQKLLGKEQAQDDRDFLKYAIRRHKILARLTNAENQFLIINAARGSGKSGLLISLEHEILGLGRESDVIIKRFFEDVTYPNGTVDVNSYINFWKNSILGWIVSEIGKRENIALSVNSITSVELAEAQGERPLSLVSFLLQRLKIKASPIEKMKFDPHLDDNTLSRIISASKLKYWILLDEMDDLYTNDPSRNNSLIGLLQACKRISQIHSSIYIRLTIRPHIMTILRTEFDVVQKLRSNELSIYWDLNNLKEMLFRRILRFDDTDSKSNFSFEFSKDQNDSTMPQNTDEVIARYFSDFDLKFSDSGRSSYRALCTMSLYRPRWMIEYCSIALSLSENNYASVTEFQKAILDYGNNRVQFIAGEHKFHIPTLQQMVNQIAGQRQYRLGSSVALKNLIIATIIKSGVRKVDSPSQNAGELRLQEEQLALTIAQELYLVEFIRGKQDVGGRDDHRFYNFPDRPSLLSTWTMERNITWELHPTFAKALNIDDTHVYRAGAEVRTFGDRRPKPKNGRGR